MWLLRLLEKLDLTIMVKSWWTMWLLRLLGWGWISPVSSSPFWRNLSCKKKMWNAPWFWVSSLRRGHAKLLCIIPILIYVLPPKLCQFGRQVGIKILRYERGSNKKPLWGSVSVKNELVYSWDSIIGPGQGQTIVLRKFTILEKNTFSVNKKTVKFSTGTAFLRAILSFINPCLSL